jgi:hypothetical protein
MGYLKLKINFALFGIARSPFLLLNVFLNVNPYSLIYPVNQGT